MLITIILETYNIKLADGRFFNREFGSDKQACVVNQKTIEEFGIKDFNQSRFIDFGNGDSTNIHANNRRL